MRTKKPRSGKAVKPAARPVRRVPRGKPKTLRRRPSPAKAKGSKGKPPKKPKRIVKRKPRAAVKTKVVRKRVIRKPRAKASPIRLERAQKVAPIFTGPGVEAGAAPAAGVSREKTAQAEAGLSIPPILLEGDEPCSPPLTGPGQKYALGPTPPAGQSGPDEGALPEAYGTGKMLLAARDPHWLYAHWDLTGYNALSADRHLVVRVVPGTIKAHPVTEIHVHPESRHWFIHTDRAETRYVAELGYYRPGRQWVTVATSAPAVTPPDTVSTDQTVRFATIPAQVRLTQLAVLAKQEVPADLPPPDAARERALAELVAGHLARQDEGSSAEIRELVRGRGEQEVSPAQLALPASPGGEAERVSSPLGPPEQPPKVFWFNINAEVVLYGATEPDASVTIGGRPVSLRPDGTFSCRFSLPDGDHTVTVSAMSAEGELRQADLRFSRRTEHRGEVGAAPQDPFLESPAATVL
jgi:hypothetical protein